jgi:hypothetical protein
MGKDGENADISVKIHYCSAGVVGFHKRSSGTAGGAFRAKGCDAVRTLIKEGMAKKSEIGLVSCQRGAYTCRQEIVVTRAGRGHMCSAFQELEASKLDLRHCQIPGDRSTPCICSWY